MLVMHACYQDAAVVHGWYEDAGWVLCGRESVYFGMRW